MKPIEAIIDRLLKSVQLHFHARYVCFERRNTAPDSGAACAYLCHIRFDRAHVFLQLRKQLGKISKVNLVGHHLSPSIRHDFGR